MFPKKYKEYCDWWVTRFEVWNKELNEKPTRKLTPITAEDSSKYPDTCPRCGKPAWIGKILSDTIYCSNHKCEHFEGRLGR